MAYTNINKSSDYFNTKLYSGNSSTQAITGVGFQPDLIWIKSRTGAVDHDWVDSVRGVNKAIASNTTSAEGSFGTNYTIDSFDSDGFTLHNALYNNASGSNYASWNWLAGGTASSNTDGSITSSVSANTTAGFSIVSWTGTGANGTIGHGLGSVPKMIIIKDRSNVRNWQVYHVGYGNGGSGQLNLTNAFSADGMFQYTNPTSLVFSVGTSVNVNASSANIIAYCFADVKGFSKFGSYTGNGSTDGTFVYTGFKPAWLMVKRSDLAEYWNILDTARADVPNANPTDQALYANDVSAEYSETQGIDLVSNGFKVREGGAGWCNASGGTYIYMAFAENPFVGSDGTPTTAR